MIPVSFASALAFYFIVWVGIIVIMWFSQERRKRKRSDYSVVRDRLYLCDKCHLFFLAEGNSKYITRCPRCNEMCFLRRKKHF